MSLVTMGRAEFLSFCPYLYYNAASGHVKQGWLNQPYKTGCETMKKSL